MRCDYGSLVTHRSVNAAWAMWGLSACLGFAFAAGCGSSPQESVSSVAAVDQSRTEELLQRPTNGDVSDPPIASTNDSTSTDVTGINADSDVGARPQLGDGHSGSATRAPLSSGSDSVAFHPDVVDRKYDAAIHDIVVREDPVVDGWDSEKFNELASKQLKHVGKILQAFASSGKSDEIDQHVAAVCDEEFASTAIRPGNLEIAHDGVAFQVMRPTPVAAQKPAMPEYHEIDGFIAALKSQASIFSNDSESHFKFKIIRVDLKGDVATTRAYFQMTAAGKNGGRVQINSTWDCAWSMGGKSSTTNPTSSAKEAPPMLRAIRVSNYEEVVAKRSSVAFSDCTQSQFNGLPVLQEQLVFGRDHWYGNLEATIGVEGRGNGIAIGDANGDGLEDIYFCQPAALPNRLFLRNADGSLRDGSVAGNVDWLDSSRGALFVDIDNDGDQDLVLALSSTLLIHENDGTGKFKVQREIPTISRLFSLNAVDFDNDGDLDLFACGYSGEGQIRPEDVFASPVPYHDANNGGPNFLFRSNGEWEFEDVTRAVGLDENNLRFSLASVWDDFDNDGDLDLYVANDFGRNNLYRNDSDGGKVRFVDIAGEAGVEDIGPGMSASWGDANNDGRIDLYVSNMFSSAGSRITRQQQFKPGAAAEDISGFKRHARGNSMFLNNGDGTFLDQSVSSGTVMGRWAWGSLFADLNNDGWRDVYVANGFVTADNNNDL